MSDAARAPEPTGAAMRRGAFRWGDRVQLTDPRGRPSTITLTPGGSFQTHKGYFRHEELEGQPEGSVVETTKGVAYLAMRPLLADYVLSMPRGAAVVYPKDAGQIVTMADIYPGARVVEAGVGSGGLTMSLLRAIGDGGSLLSIERRADFAEIAVANVEGFFGGEHPAWEVAVGDFADVLGELREPGSVDRIVLDMLAPWENLDAAATALAPGGVFLAYVATATQLSRTAEDLRADGRFTEPVAWESMVRGWHLEGLAVRPEHRMIGHTGFLLTARRLGPGVEPPERRRRPQASATTNDPDEIAKLAADAARVQIGEEYGPEDFGERGATAKKTRRVARDAGVIRRAAERSARAATSEGGQAVDEDAENPSNAPTLDVTAPPEEGR